MSDKEKQIRAQIAELEKLKNDCDLAEAKFFEFSKTISTSGGGISERHAHAREILKAKLYECITK